MRNISNKWIKRFFPLIVLLLLAPWPVAYAHDFDNQRADQDGARIAVAEASAQPTWTAFGKAIGGVTPGDLFNIDATDNPADIVVTLYITNTQELISCYRYLILNVGIYSQCDSGQWERISNDNFITMRNGQVSFTLQGLAQYKITIDGGNFYCTTSNANGSSLSPQFYLEAN